MDSKGKADVVVTADLLPDVAMDAARAIKDYFKFTRGGWATFWMCDGGKNVSLTMEEFTEFQRVCRDSGLGASEERPTFEKMVKLMYRYGDSGFGQKPTDMSRVVYWYQHAMSDGSGQMAEPEATNATSRSSSEVVGMYQA